MLIIGHKGSKGEYPQNTLNAVQDAILKGADLVEIDIRVTKDDIPVLYHDSRLNNKSKLEIKDTEFKNLIDSYSYLTKLEDVLKLKNIELILDIKPSVEIEPIVNLIKKHKSNKLLITSFDFKLLLKMKKKLPNLKYAVLDRWSGVRANHRAKKLNTNIIIMNQKWLWNGFIKAVKNSGIELYVYTLNNVDKALIWKNYGIAGVITDFPESFN